MSNVVSFTDALNDLKRVQAPTDEVAPLKNGDGDGTSGGMDIWHQSVETRLGSLNDKMDRNLLWTMGGFGAVVLAGLTMFLATTSKLDQSVDKLAAKIDGVSAQVSEVGERVARLEGAAGKQK